MAVERWPLIHVGMKAFVPAAQVVALLDVDSAPIRALVARAREQGRVLDATRGRRARTAVRLANGDIVLSALTTASLAGRMGWKPREDEEAGA